MPRVDVRTTHASVVYIYPSEHYAANRIGGGTGSFALIPRKGESVPSRRNYVDGKLIRLNAHVYVVTAYHNIFCEDVDAGGKKPVISINHVDSGFVLLTTEQSEWIADPENDIAILKLPDNLGEVHRIEIMGFTLDMFVNRDDLRWDGYMVIDFDGVGTGDEVLMISRLPKHDGRDQNTPVVQFGNIAMLPIERLKDAKRKINREIFVAEMHSRTGMSGSPVAVFKTELDIDESVRDFNGFMASAKLGLIKTRTGSLRLLGIHVGQFRFDEPNPNAKLREASHFSGLSEIIPAWVIAEMLTTEEMRNQRDQQDVKDGFGELK